MYQLVCSFSEIRRPWDEVKMGKHFIVPSNAYGYVDSDWYLDSLHRPGCSGWLWRKRKHPKESKQESDKIELRIHGGDTAGALDSSGKNDRRQRNKSNIHSAPLVRHALDVNSSDSASSDDEQGTDESAFSMGPNGEGNNWTFRKPGFCSRVAGSCDISCGASALVFPSVPAKQLSEIRHNGECRDHDHTSQEVTYAKG